MFLLPAALCCLCSGECFQPIRSQQSLPVTNTDLHLPVCLSAALVAVDAQLIQDQVSVTRTAGKKASFSCGGIDQCYYVFWYQKKDNETFRLILRIDPDNGDVYRGYNHPQQDDFSASKTSNGCELSIQTVQPSHSASYYCSCDVSTVRNDASSLNKKQLMSNRVCDRKRAANHSQVHVSAASQPSLKHTRPRIYFTPLGSIFVSDIPAGLWWFHTASTKRQHADAKQETIQSTHLLLFY